MNENQKKKKNRKKWNSKDENEFYVSLYEYRIFVVDGWLDGWLAGWFGLADCLLGKVQLFQVFWVWLDFELQFFPAVFMVR